MGPWRETCNRQFPWKLLEVKLGCSYFCYSVIIVRHFMLGWLIHCTYIFIHYFYNYLQHQPNKHYSDLLIYPTTTLSRFLIGYWSVRPITTWFREGRQRSSVTLYANYKESTLEDRVAVFAPNSVIAKTPESKCISRSNVDTMVFAVRVPWEQNLSGSTICQSQY